MATKLTLLDVLKVAVKKKPRIHRVPSDTKRGRQIISMSSKETDIHRGQGNNEQSTAAGRERTNSKRNI